MSIFKVQAAQPGGVVAFEPSSAGVEVVLDHSALRHHAGYLVLTNRLMSEQDVDREVTRLVEELHAAARVARSLLRPRVGGRDSEQNG
jgi:hypothetical protein